jgi:hypothetical protein
MCISCGPSSFLFCIRDTVVVSVCPIRSSPALPLPRALSRWEKLKTGRVQPVNMLPTYRRRGGMRIIGQDRCRQPVAHGLHQAKPNMYGCKMPGSTIRIWARASELLISFT